MRTLIYILITLPQWSKAQDIFLKGELTDTTGKKIHAFIRPTVWRENPVVIYRIGLVGERQRTSLTAFKEVKIGDKLKLLRYDVEIDRSSEEEPLSLIYDPEWANQTVYLNTLVEGRVNLYNYQSQNFTRYFISIDNQSPQQLIFKRYRKGSDIEWNTTYRTQLFEKFNCQGKPYSYFEGLSFNKDSLIEYIKGENVCYGVEPVVYKGLQEAMIQEENNSSPPMQSTETLWAKSEPENSKTKRSIFSVHYFGVEINPLFRQIFPVDNNSEPSGNLFQLQYSSNTANGAGYNLGFSYNRTTLREDIAGVIRQSVMRNLIIRAGYDHKFSLGEKWMGVLGFDLLLTKGKDRTTTDNLFGSTITLMGKSTGWGTGLRSGIMYFLSKRVSVGTELTFYGIFTKDVTSIDGQIEETTRRGDINLALPTVVFLTIAVGK